MTSKPSPGGEAAPSREERRRRDAAEEEKDPIGQLIGNFGKWQFIMTILISIFQIPNTFHICSPVYQAAGNTYWCQRPDHLHDLSVENWTKISQSEDGCHEIDVNWKDISLDDINAGTVSFPANTSKRSCKKWEYALGDIGNTWTSEWDLVCDQEYLTNVAEMFFLVGVATGGVTSGYLSDKFGRKKLLTISAILQTIFALSLYFVTSFKLYLALRTLLGLVSVSVTYSGLILAIEFMGGKWCTIAGMYNLFPLPLTYMIIAGIAYATQDYKKLQLCIAIPGFIIINIIFVITESPRWLLVKGKIEKLKRIIERAARFNKITLPDGYDKILVPPPQEESPNILHLFRSRYLRRITICFLCIWFCMNFVYYGLILNMNSFGGNIYLNSALAGLVEIPAIAIAMYIITKSGKKWLFCSTWMCAAVACFCATGTEGIENILWLKITFLMIAKFTISAGNTIMPVYTAELYPTSIRNAGVGAANVAAGVALILIPYTSLLSQLDQHLLIASIAVFSLLGGITVIFLPERIPVGEAGL